MADNLIQIKRSQTTAQPTSLANGELAFTAAGNVVFIGNFGSVLPIAGERRPGLLTANQALVANSTGFLNELKAGNVYVTSGISANGSLGTVGDVLTSNGTATFWQSAASLAVGPTYVQNTDSRELSGNLYFSGANTYIANLNVVTINRSPKLTLSGDVSGNVTFTNLGDATLNVTIDNNTVALGTDTTGDYVSTITGGGGIVVSGGTGETSTPTVSANVDNSTIEVSGGALRVKDNGIALGTKTTGDYVQSITAGNGVSISVTSGESAQPVIAAVVGSTLVSNTTGIHFNSTQETLTVNGLTTLNGNVVLGSSSADIITFNGLTSGDIAPAASGTGSLGQSGQRYNKLFLFDGGIDINNLPITAVGGSILSVGGGLTVNTNLIANTATFYHNVLIGGDLTLTGNVVYANVESYVVTDPLIHLAANNTNSDALDIGFFGNYNTGGGAYENTGLFRDASDGVYKLFDGLQVEPTTFVDTANSTYNQATLQAYLSSGALISNATNLNITATSSLAVALVANSLTLSTALGTVSGGTGQTTYALGDLLVGTGAGSLSKLAVGALGYVLQSNGSALIYATLDGGSF
jgi:hypothetical protein